MRFPRRKPKLEPFAVYREALRQLELRVAVVELRVADARGLAEFAAGRAEMDPPVPVLEGPPGISHPILDVAAGEE